MDLISSTNTKYFFVAIAILLGALVIAEGAVVLGPTIFALVSVPFILFSLYNFRYGTFLLFLYSAVIFQVARMLDSGLPFGILFDFMIILAFISVLFSRNDNNKLDFKFSSSITRIYIITFIYFGFQIANPAATSIAGWLASSRSFTLLLLYFVFLSFFSNTISIKRFIYLWLMIAIVAALYGLSQEFLGLMDFEWKYIYAVPERYSLFYNWGHMRVFSIFSDPSTFGIFMAFSGLSSLILAFGPFNVTKRVLLLLFSLVMFLSMSFSGTRTAYALVMVGVVFFIVLNIKNPKVLAGSMVMVMGFVILMVGPFYSGPIIRMRSTFKLGDDPSMRVRDNNRVIYQKYIQTHPIGGGVNTAGVPGLKYSPSHPLAGRPPDSGYIKTALELGWIGLIIAMALNATVVFKGISNHYKLKNSRLKTYNIAFAIPFFALSVANFTQDAMIQKPIIVPIIATYALMVKIMDIEGSLKETS